MHVGMYVTNMYVCCGQLTSLLPPPHTQLRSDEGSLLFLLISLRLFPMTPNWLLNMASPLVGVPLPLFFLSVLIGKVGVASML